MVNNNTLKETEWMMYNQVLLQLYAADDVKQYKKKLLNVFKVLVPYTVAYILLYDEDGNLQKNMFTYDGIEKKNVIDYIEKYYDIDYMRYVMDLTSSTAVYRDTDILDEAIRTKHEFFTKFLQPNNLMYGAGLVLVKDAKIIGVVNLFRNSVLGDFTARDMFVLTLIKDHLTHILYRVLKGGKVVKKSKSELDFELTEREKEICKYIMTGISNAEISDIMSISISTVKKHIYNIYEKTGVRNRILLRELIENYDVL